MLDLIALSAFTKDLYWVKMRDGAQLSTYVCLPNSYSGQPTEVVLHRTPYNKDTDPGDDIISYLLR